ncbi:hypothetical protein MMC34_003847 [Xylographa carneopallida]|nr:hypothetical protein [Xylographa carneopallida]
MILHLPIALFALLLPPTTVLAHRGGKAPAAQEPLSPDTDWATRHMAEEHHIANFDPGAFFSLHDYDSSGGWTPDEVRRTYGLDDGAAAVAVDPDQREQVTREVFALLDADKNGVVEREEWMAACEAGVRLPDFGLGPGHHGDDEYEYEIHHFEKFHDENTKEEDLIHPEDIAHFAKHDREEAEAERQEVLNRQAINEANIPLKFRRQ